MQCDFCDKLITGDHGLVIDGEMTYHGSCYLNLQKKFPKVIQEDNHVNNKLLPSLPSQDTRNR